MERSNKVAVEFDRACVCVPGDTWCQSCRAAALLVTVAHEFHADDLLQSSRAYSRVVAFDSVSSRYAAACARCACDIRLQKNVISLKEYSRVSCEVTRTGHESPVKTGGNQRVWLRIDSVGMVSVDLMWESDSI